MQPFLLRKGCGTQHLWPVQIVCIESSSIYSRADFATSPPLLLCKILQWYEDLLSHESFVRVHWIHLLNRSFMANCQQVGSCGCKAGSRFA